MQQLEQEFANAIGFVMDNAIDPPKQLGMAFLVSKSRVVTCASEVFHYVDAPWAISIYFPFTDVRVAVKSINLHADFDKVDARTRYLGQIGSPQQEMHSYMNDIALLMLDPAPPEPMTERLAELNRALCLPFSSEKVEASGNLHGTEFVQLIQTIIESGRQGLLTLYDHRNIPVANILIARGGILKVFFRQVMSSEMAFCELVHRAPAVAFAFRPEGNINWGEVPDVQTPPDRLVYEAMRRAGEIPKLFQQLGGLNARYKHVIQTFDPTNASEEIQWMVQPLWNSLDGYITLDKLPKRIGVDTYTTLIAIRELVNRGVISPISQSSPFPCTGIMGNPLVSHTDFEVHPWDPLQAFYLDPLSYGPQWLKGNFFGVANSLQPKNMLHTVAVPNDLVGGLILKDYKLIGIHSGPQILKPGQPAPPVKCYQFMWMGALLELSSRKYKANESEDGSTVGSLRTLEHDAQEQGIAPVGSEQKIQCPNCFASNSEYGECATCHTIIEPPVEDESTNAKGAKGKLKKFQKKHGLSNRYVAILAGLILLPIISFGMSQLGKVAAPPPPPDKLVKEKPSDRKAVDLASDSAGFPATPPPKYRYADTSEKTSPSKSFGIESEQANQKILFVIYDDMTPVDALSNFAGKPPFTEVDRTETDVSTFDSGDQILGNGKLKWILGKYTQPGKQKPLNLLLAAFPAAQEGKSILVIGQGLADSDQRQYNHKTTLFLLDELASETTAYRHSKDLQDLNKDQSAKKLEDELGDDEDEEGGKQLVKESTPEEIDKFVVEAQKLIQEKFEMPEDAAEHADTVEKETGKPKVWKMAGWVIGIDRDGNIKRLEKKGIDENTKYEKLSKAMEKAVTDVGKFENPPVTKAQEFKFRMRLKGKEIEIKPGD
ncbi:hypothetical protein KA183_08220 [bacterium]|nr:hypothetical protein [bacterium]QQR56896.1 MAG: hypothetical protein IPG59_18150 [Candidatus Melainabacteria bacterium]